MPRSKVVDPDWMTYVDAMPVLGRSHVAITRLVRLGRIRSRDQVGRAMPSLWRQDVLRVATELEQARQAAEERRRARPVSAAPDDGHVWLTPTEAGLVLGMTPTGVRYRVDAGLIPATRCGHRTWLRRDHVEQAAAARAFGRRRRGEV